MIDFSGKNGEQFYTNTDITSFAFSVPVEIPSSNAFFAEGANSRNNTVIALSGDAIKQGEEEVYHNISETDMEIVNKTAPIFVAVSNSFWFFKVDKDGNGECKYEINRSWNRFFVDNFPELLREMVAGNV
jgi:hypothetical protein